MFHFAKEQTGHFWWELLPIFGHTKNASFPKKCRVTRLAPRSLWSKSEPSQVETPGDVAGFSPTKGWDFQVQTPAWEPSKISKLLQKKHMPCLIMHSEAAKNPDAIDSNLKNVCVMVCIHTLRSAVSVLWQLARYPWSRGVTKTNCNSQYTICCVSQYFLSVWNVHNFTMLQFLAPVLHGWYTPRLDGSRKIPICSSRSLTIKLSSIHPSLAIVNSFIKSRLLAGLFGYPPVIKHGFAEKKQVQQFFPAYLVWRFSSQPMPAMYTERVATHPGSARR